MRGKRGVKRRRRVEEGSSRSELEVSTRLSTVLVNIFFVPAAGGGTTHSRGPRDGARESRSRTVTHGHALARYVAHTSSYARRVCVVLLMHV